MAFIHKSYAADFKQEVVHNERLEFLGDAILGSVVAKQLYLDYPNSAESQLTLYKIALVREEHLAKISQQIGLDQQILLWNGEEKMGGRNKDVILADGLEALIGFINLDQGQDVAQAFILTYIYPEITQLEWFSNKSYKTLLQEVAQSQTKITPHYVDTVLQQDTKGNPTLFESVVMMGDRELGRGTGINKKKAQESAAEQWHHTLLHTS